MTTRREARHDWDAERAFEACMKEERERILDLLDQGDKPAEIIEMYKQYPGDSCSTIRQVVETIVEERK